MKKANLKKVEMFPPMVDYFNKLKAFMCFDDEISLELDYDEAVITITISNAPKAAAWRQILPEEMKFGNQTMSIEIECDKIGVDENVLVTALEGNRLFSRYENIVLPKSDVERHFCYMNPTVVQFYNDNFASPESVETRVAEDLAREVLDIPTLNFCTECIINNEE